MKIELDKCVEGDLSLVEATMDDAQLLLDWRNDDTTRAASREKEVIDFDSHCRWLEATLKNPERLLLIAKIADEAVGTTRAFYENNEYVLSWTVAPSARGRGVGKRMVKLLSTNIDGPQFAEVAIGNHASRAIAEHIGLKLCYEGEGVWHFR